MSTVDGSAAVSEEDVEKYLKKFGYGKALQQFQEDKERARRGEAPSTVKADSLDDFARANAPAQVKKDPEALLLFRSRVDPNGWVEGLKSLAEFIHNSLDIHRPELLPILLPVLVHIYLDLVYINQVEAARRILTDFQGDYRDTHRALLNQLSAIGSEAQLKESSFANRWRTQNYRVRMTPRGKGLLISWLQSTGLAFTTRGIELEGKGRDKILSVLNERITIEELPPGSKVDLFEHGLETDLLHPQASTSLALGVPPTDVKLAREAQRVVREADGEGAADESLAKIDPVANIKPALQAPEREKLPPSHATMRIVDVNREVSKLREARKRVKLGPDAFTAAPGEAPRSGAAKPSVCMFTVHDARDTLVSSAISDDARLLACGFSESYIRLWDVTGGKLKAAHGDYNPDDVRGYGDLKKLKAKDEGSQTRKLIGHGGPVYSIAFDPTPGPAAPPRFMLSASQDASVRLWSLDTYSCLVAYRGHREPVWDVDWSPKGTYFASASRDRTARVWTPDRTSPLRIMAGHLSDVDAVRFHPNTLYLGTASSDHTCRLWDVQTGHCMRIFQGHTGPICALAFSPDGRYLASAGEDTNVNLWDIAAGKILKSMPGHTARVDSLAFSIDARLLLSGGVDNTIRAWDVLGGSSVTTDVTDGSVTVDSATSRAALQQTLDKASATIGVMPRSAAFAGAADPEPSISPDLLCTMLTKRTPINSLRFTYRNLCLAVGPSSNEPSSSGMLV